MRTVLGIVSWYNGWDAGLRRADPQVKPRARAWGVVLPSRPGSDTGATKTKDCARAYKDVVHEDAIKVGGATKAPDYCFRIGGTRKFFVKATKPSVSIKEDVQPAYHLRRYAWSAKLPLIILTDFEELAVYDCRVRPVKTDNAAQAHTSHRRVGDGRKIKVSQCRQGS